MKLGNYTVSIADKDRKGYVDATLMEGERFVCSLSFTEAGVKPTKDNPREKLHAETVGRLEGLLGHAVDLQQAAKMLEAVAAKF